MSILANVPEFHRLQQFLDPAARTTRISSQIQPKNPNSASALPSPMDILNAYPQRPGDRPIYTPPHGPPQTDRIPAAVYEAMREDNIRSMFHAFYKRLAESSIKDMFPKSEQNLMRAADKSAAMFTFLFGGPHLYQKTYGQPMMRARHLPFIIDEPARQEWLRCYRETLDEAPEKYAMPEEHVEAVWKFVYDFSSWMVNAQD